MPSIAKKESNLSDINVLRIANKVARGYKQSQADHDDMVGYILLETYKYISKWDAPLQKYTTFFRFARFRAVDFWRLRYNRRTKEAKPGVRVIEATEMNQGSYETPYDGFDDMIRVLSPRDREIFSLRYRHNYTEEKIGEIVGLSAAGVHLVLTRNLEVLRDFNGH